MSLSIHHVLAAAAALLACLSAQAESLRCTGGSAAEGDSRISVAYKCGQPVLKDSFCAPVYYYHPVLRQYVAEATPNPALPCQQVEDWLYERGSGNLTATVRFRSGVVQSITYGREPH